MYVRRPWRSHAWWIAAHRSARRVALRSLRGLEWRRMHGIYHAGHGDLGVWHGCHLCSRRVRGWLHVHELMLWHRHHHWIGWRILRCRGRRLHRGHTLLEHLHAHALRDGRDLLRVSSVAIGLLLWLHYRLALGLRMLRRLRGERRGLILHVLGVRRERNWADVWI